VVPKHRLPPLRADFVRLKRLPNVAVSTRRVRPGHPGAAGDVREKNVLQLGSLKPAPATLFAGWWTSA
jgi:hypothetical protein